MLTREDVEQIHTTVVRILAQVGVQFPSEEALSVLRRHGVRTEGETVFLTERQLMDAVSTAPDQFSIEARNPERNVVIGDGVPVFAPGYGAPFIVDPEVGKRAATLEDYHNLTKLVHALPNQDMSGHLMVEPSDGSPGTAHLQMLLATMIHSDKPFVGSTAGGAGAEHTMEMAEILFGGGLAGRPVTLGLINSLSPLGYSQAMLDALLVYARRRQPLILAALSMAGLTGPITLAGVLAHQTAELLAGIVLVQLISPGTPVILGSASTNLDMKTGGLAIGGPEQAVIIAAHADLCRFYGIPSRSGGALTDAHSPDAQAGYESMMSLLTTVNNHLDFVLHAGGILSSYLAFSYEKLVLDDEICGMVRRFKRGLVVSPETLAFEVIAKVGPGGNYLMDPHTLKRCRREFWQPAAFSRVGIESWMEAGRPDAVAQARIRWQALLDEHQDPPMEVGTADRLRTYVKKRM